MKNIIKVLGITALVAAIGLSFAGCAGEDSPGPAAPQKMVYTWDAGADSYSLEITEASEGRAVYTPKSGDTYVLTITLEAGETKKSNGTVAVSSNGKESTLTLTPAGASETFKVTVVATATNALVTGVTGTITLTDNTTVTVQEKVTPVKVYDTFVFTATSWNYECSPNTNKYNIGETWAALLPLSDFTPVIPRKGDTYTFRLSGTTDPDMKWFGFQIYCRSISQPWNYQWLGSAGETVELSGTFDETFVVRISNDPEIDNDDNGEIGLNMENMLWETRDGDDYGYDHGVRLPEGTKTGDVMATVRNFKISLVKIE